jgi:hypothetical protein
MIEELLKAVVLFIEKKGTIVVAGSQLGAQVITADDDTGGTIGDLNGYTVTFQTMEPDFSRILSNRCGINSICYCVNGLRLVFVVNN